MGFFKFLKKGNSNLDVPKAPRGMNLHDIQPGMLTPPPMPGGASFGDFPTLPQGNSPPMAPLRNPFEVRRPPEMQADQPGNDELSPPTLNPPLPDVPQAAPAWPARPVPPKPAAPAFPQKKAEMPDFAPEAQDAFPSPGPEMNWDDLPGSADLPGPEEPVADNPPEDVHHDEPELPLPSIMGSEGVDLTSDEPKPLSDCAIPEEPEEPVEPVESAETEEPIMAVPIIPKSEPEVSGQDMPEIQADSIDFTKPLFVRHDHCVNIVKNINSAKNQFKDLHNSIFRMNEFEDDKSKIFERWRKEIERLQKKLMTVDSILFNTGDTA
ncbi:MAG: hypothetical protein ABH879_01145 [archaeon]